jgi:glycosyltransferase involved in cell wall biosynthesis
MVINNQSINTVHLFVTSLGNHFMIEIAEIFNEGFNNNEITSLIKVDQRPSTQPKPGLMQVVVAPHEFFNLFLEPGLNSKEKIKDFVKAVYLLNTEQPNTPWFEMTCKHVDVAKGVLDLTEHAALEYRKRGVFTVHAPLGYASCFDAGIDPHNLPDRTFDLLFLGSNSPKRELFLSQNAALFNRYQSNIVIARQEKPRFLQTKGFFAEYQRNHLLRSCKILVNVHANHNTYFEWLRVIMAIANGCLVISETSDYIEPLINGKHLIVTELDDIAAQCEYYLEHELERLAMVNEAYKFVTQEFNTTILCKSILQKLEQQTEHTVELQRV